MIKSFFPKISFLLFLSLILFNACGTPPIFDETPEIEWNRFTFDTIGQCFDQVGLIISFTDGDGDLGRDEEDTTTNMYIIDARTDDTIQYIIPYIPQQGVANGISGEIEVDLTTIPCIIPGNPVLCSDIPDTYDSVTYKVIIRDREGRWSNEIESEPLYLKCFQ